MARVRALMAAVYFSDTSVTYFCQWGLNAVSIIQYWNVLILRFHIYRLYFEKLVFLKHNSI